MDPLNFLSILNLIDKIPVEARPYVAGVLVFFCNYIMHIYTIKRLII